jgi:hypothetical protein
LVNRERASDPAKVANTFGAVSDDVSLAPCNKSNDPAQQVSAAPNARSFWAGRSPWA